MNKTNRSFKATDTLWNQIREYGQNHRPPLTITQVLEKAIYSLLPEIK